MTEISRHCSSKRSQCSGKDGHVSILKHSCIQPGPGLSPAAGPGAGAETFLKKWLTCPRCSSLGDAEEATGRASERESKPAWPAQPPGISSAITVLIAYSALWISNVCVTVACCWPLAARIRADCIHCSKAVTKVCASHFNAPPPPPLIAGITWPSAMDQFYAYLGPAKCCSIGRRTGRPHEWWLYGSTCTPLKPAQHKA